MSELVEWIAAVADGEYPAGGAPRIAGRPRAEEKQPNGTFSQNSATWQDLPTHNFSEGTGARGLQDHQDALDRNPDLWLYRGRTVALLRRYMRISLETGRLPSIIGKELFRATVTSYRSVTFEDRVIFVRDVEKILGRLEYWDQQLIARIILQEHTREKAAYLLHCCRKTIDRRVPEVLDLLSESFLDVGLLVAVPSGRRSR